MFTFRSLYTLLPLVIPLSGRVTGKLIPIYFPEVATNVLMTPKASFVIFLSTQQWGLFIFRGLDRKEIVSYLVFRERHWKCSRFYDDIRSCYLNLQILVLNNEGGSKRMWIGRPIVALCQWAVEKCVRENGVARKHMFSGRGRCCHCANLCFSAWILCPWRLCFGLSALEDIV